MASVFVALRSWRWALETARDVNALPCSFDPSPPPLARARSFARRRPGRWNENENLVVVFVVAGTAVAIWTGFDSGAWRPLSASTELF